MKIFKITLLLVLLSVFTNCASRYRSINPKTVNYKSAIESDGIKLEYKYGLLEKKYKKKELKKGIKLVAVKITNASTKDIRFGDNVKLIYGNGTEALVMENSEVFKMLKQSPASYLWYLLLTPMNFTASDGTDSSTTPVGLIVGPGLAGGNIIAASSANKKFKTEMLSYTINGTIIKKGEVKYGLVGIKSDSFDALRLKIE